MSKIDSYNKLMTAYKRAYPKGRGKTNVQAEVNMIWDEIKLKENLSEEVENHRKKYDSIFLKRTSNIYKFLSNQNNKECSSTTLSSPATTLSSPAITLSSPATTTLSSRTITLTTPSVTTTISATTSQTNQSATTTELSTITTTQLRTATPTTSQSYPKRAQMELIKQIEFLNHDLVGLYKRKLAGMLTTAEEETLTTNNAKKKKYEKELKLKKDQQKRSKLAREKKKLINTQQSTSIVTKIGRPPIEKEQPGLMEAIVELAKCGYSAADSHRSSDIYRSIKSLDELKEALDKQGFILSRSGLYIRLLPKRSYSNEGNRHRTTVPVKLTRCLNTEHSQHSDSMFCMTTINHLRQIASYLGPKQCIILSQDDKCRIPLGITAANKQAPIVMHVEYKVTLPDHDFVIANGHKLIPSVYAALTIKPNGFGDKDFVTYSGPTFITIRSAKHSKSTALSHGADFERLLELNEMQSFVKYDEMVKPVVIILSDGGPDENPRYQKVISVAINHFVKHNLDAMFVATNAPGRSAFNPVERRMAPLSRELSGLLLPYDKYGTHLDSQRRTKDIELEKKNFQFAGETLAEIWNGLKIDGYETVSEFVTEENSDLQEVLIKDTDWFSKHVRSSQYLLQIVKCKDLNCCNPRSDYFSLLEQFLPAPIPLSQISNKVLVDTKNGKYPDLGITKSLDISMLIGTTKIPKGGNLSNIQYDLFCPTMESEINKRTCLKCNLYFASGTLLTQHAKSHKIATKKLKPVALKARREKEVLIKTNTEILWVDVEAVDLDDLEVEPLIEEEEFPIITISDLINSFEDNDC